MLLLILFIIIIGGILVLFIYITRLASNKIFSPSNKIFQEVGRTKYLSAPRYKNMRQPYIYNDPPSQFSVLGKAPRQNMFNFLYKYKATPTFSNGKLGKNFLLLLYFGT